MNNIITIDGPSGAGKGTVTQLVAKHFGWHMLDSGALYRILGVATHQAGVDLSPANLTELVENQITEFARHLDVSFQMNLATKEVEPFLSGVNLGKEIRTDQAGQFASKVAAIPTVRQALFERQRDFAQEPGLVADGRDMGTVVFTDAPVKIFLTASAECRAERRYQQLINKGVGANMRALLQSIQERDERDRTRSVAPLLPAEDALVIDSSHLTIDQVVMQVIDFAKQKLKNISLN